MSPASWASAVDDVGLVPFGSGLDRGLDERSLCTRGIQLETLAGLGLPGGAGLTIPVPNVPGFTSPDRAKAAMNLLESISGRTISSTTESNGLVLLRLSASAPQEAAGLPPDLVCLGLKMGVLPEDLGETGRADLAKSWWKSAAFIAENALGVPADEIGVLAIDIDDPADRIEPLMRLCDEHGSATRSRSSAPIRSPPGPPPCSPAGTPRARPVPAASRACRRTSPWRCTSRRWW